MRTSDENTRVHIFAPKWLIAKIDETADGEGLSRSEFVRKCCAAYFLAEGQEQVGEGR